MIIFIEQPLEATLYEAADTLAEKLLVQARPNAIIKLTTDEMELMRTAHIVGISSKSSPVELIEIDRDKSYIAVCDNSVVLTDLISLISKAKLAIRIVRTRNV